MTLNIEMLGGYPGVSSFPLGITFLLSLHGQAVKMSKGRGEHLSLWSIVAVGACWLFSLYGFIASRR